MPANYTLKRRIGSIIRTGGIIKPFVQDGDLFMFKSPSPDIAATNPGTFAVTSTVTVPTGIRVRAQLVVASIGSALTDQPSAIYISDLALTDVAAGNTSAFTSNFYTGVASISAPGGSTVEVMTNMSGQVRSRVAISAAGTVLHISTMGWSDGSGRASA